MTRNIYAADGHGRIHAFTPDCWRKYGANYTRVDARTARRLMLQVEGMPRFKANCPAHYMAARLPEGRRHDDVPREWWLCLRAAYTTRWIRLQTDFDLDLACRVIDAWGDGAEHHVTVMRATRGWVRRQLLGSKESGAQDVRCRLDMTLETRTRLIEFADMLPYEGPRASDDQYARIRDAFWDMLQE